MYSENFSKCISTKMLINKNHHDVTKILLKATFNINNNNSEH